MSDLISRQAAIDALERSKDKTAKGDIGGFYNTIIQNDIDKIKGLPSARPEQKSDIEEAVEYIKNAQEYLRDIGETWCADYLSDAIELLVG